MSADEPATAASRTPIHFSCRECGKPFVMMKSYLDAHRKRFGKDPSYCSRPCSAIGRKKDSDERHKTECANCGRLFYRNRSAGNGTVYKAQKVCSRACQSEWVSKVHRTKHGSPSISRRVRRGYALLRLPPTEGARSVEVFEHRYTMQRHLGRPLLRGETVHHIDGDRTNNDLSNLELWRGNHGPGQRVADKVAWAIELLRTYPEFAHAAGVELRDVVHHWPARTSLSTVEI